MSLAFMHPALVWGALLGAVPIVIHLINRRRHRRHDFAAIAFVLRSKTRQARKLRLKRILLLACRTLLCILIPLALARPYLEPRDAQAQVVDRGPAAVVVILDTSLSMRYRLEDRTLFDHGRRQAREIIDGLSPEDAVAVLPCADGHEGPLPGTTYESAEARRQVATAEAGYRRADMMACLSAATRILADSPLPNKRAYVVTDLTASGWRLDTPPPAVPTDEGEVPLDVVVVDAADGRDLPNRWIEDLTVEPALALGARGYGFTFTVRASGGASAQGLSAMVRRGDQALVRGFIDLPANGTVRRTLSYQFPEGGEVFGRIEIDDDPLDVDDHYPFVMQVQRDVRALVVDGNPSVNRYEEEVFFVERALFPGRGAPSTIRPRVVDVDGFARADVSAFDLVLLLNVRELPAGKAEALESFVEGGGGLFISAGPNLDPDAYNRDIGNLLPATLHIAKAAEGGTAAFSAVAWDHPVFSVFVGEGREGFVSARFSKYLLTRPPRPGATVLATFDDGAPALLVRPHGQGRVALYTSTVSRTWSDFPIRTAFLPTMQQVAGYLARALEERRDAHLMVGDTHTLTVPEGIDELLVVPPDGRPVGFRGEALSEGEVLFSGTDAPGIYRVLVRRGRGEPTLARGLSFVVRTDPSESDTTRLEPSELAAHLGGSIAGGNGTGLGRTGTGTRPVWSWLLVLAVAAILGEGWLLRR
jgi:hypothetical protein